MSQLSPSRPASPSPPSRPRSRGTPFRASGDAPCSTCDCPDPDRPPLRRTLSSPRRCSPSLRPALRCCGPRFEPSNGGLVLMALGHPRVDSCETVEPDHPPLRSRGNTLRHDDVRPIPQAPGRWLPFELFRTEWFDPPLPISSWHVFVNHVERQFARLEKLGDEPWPPCPYSCIYGSEGRKPVVHASLRIVQATSR